MPRKYTQKQDKNVGLKSESKGIKKEAKAEERSKALEDAVLASKDSTHYVLILDDSGSMCGKPWNDLKAAADQFLRTLSNSREAATSKVSCVIYNDQSRIVFQNEVPSLSLQAKIQYKGGMTEYAPALRHARTICQNCSDQFSKIVFYFMSDGQPHDSNTYGNVVDSLKTDPFFNKIQFYACGFGHSSFSELEKLAKMFPKGQMKQAPTVEELKQSMLFILRADNSGPKKNTRKAQKTLKPLWNREKLQIGDHFSSISYL